MRILVRLTPIKMKPILTTLLLLAVAASLQAQTNTAPKPKRSVPIHLLHHDSVNMALNENFNRIEDSCATMIRYAHIIPKEHKYVGKFKDVSQLDTAVILTEGEYTADGLKTGLFTAYHLNGELQSKGVYKNNNYDGHWEVFYDNGKPHLFFDARNDTVRIMDVWDAAGKQVVIHGKGTYSFDVKPVSWEGKLLNGLPDGTWHAYKTTDASKKSLVDEYFKNGTFHDGSGPAGKYTDASHITSLITAEETFPYTRAEKFLIATAACDAVRRIHYVSAQFTAGRYDYSTYVWKAIGKAVALSNNHMIRDNNVIKITGFVSEKGDLVELKSEGAFDTGLANNIIHNLLVEVPLLTPATADGVPVRQPVVITVSFNGLHYTYGYRFVPFRQPR